jgi:hypothetical protein
MVMLVDSSLRVFLGPGSKSVLGILLVGLQERAQVIITSTYFPWVRKRLNCPGKANMSYSTKDYEVQVAFSCPYHVA